MKKASRNWSNFWSSGILYSAADDGQESEESSEKVKKKKKEIAMVRDI